MDGISERVIDGLTTKPIRIKYLRSDSGIPNLNAKRIGPSDKFGYNVLFAGKDILLGYKRFQAFGTNEEELHGDGFIEDVIRVGTRNTLFDMLYASEDGKTQRCDKWKYFVGGCVNFNILDLVDNEAEIGCKFEYIYGIGV